MGQMLDLHSRLLDVLTLAKTAVDALPGREMRVYETPPIQLPEMPCVFLLTPDSTFQRRDTEMGEDIVTTVLRLCIDAGEPQTTLLELTDAIIDVIDVWVWNDPPDPIEQAKRTGMRGVTPVFDGVPTRGADFPIETQLVRGIHPD